MSEEDTNKCTHVISTRHMFILFDDLFSMSCENYLACKGGKIMGYSGLLGKHEGKKLLEEQT
jgi:hypothetical protein